MTPLTTPIFDFSLGHKLSYDSDYDSDSDSVASENQPLVSKCYMQDIFDKRLRIQLLSYLCSVEEIVARFDHDLESPKKKGSGNQKQGYRYMRNRILCQPISSSLTDIMFRF